MSAREMEKAERSYESLANHIPKIHSHYFQEPGLARRSAARVFDST